jgi:serine/threonine protein kinase
LSERPAAAPPLFGGYELERPLGHGGMAETFLATHRGPQGFVRRVCLKRILPTLAADAAFVRAFQEEARLAVRLVHPHIAQVYDFGSDQGTWWMTLEFIGGGDLRELLRRLGAPLEVDFARVLIIDIASALAYAHELEIDGQPARIVHRDVSPSNVLVDELGNFKLADFGIAKSALSTANTTRGAVKGKAWYMSPEQAAGKPLDGTADLWALGVVLYEALSGRRPFDGATDLATMLQVLEGKRPKLIEVAPHVPQDFCDVIERLLCVETEGRFASALALLDALANIAPPTSTRRRLAARMKELNARASAPSAPLATQSITSLALEDAAHDTVQTAAAHEPTRTRTVYDQALQRSVAMGAFEATQELPNPTSIEPPAPQQAEAATPTYVPTEAKPMRWIWLIPLAILALVLVAGVVAYGALNAVPSSQATIPSALIETPDAAVIDAPIVDAFEPPRGIEVPAELMRDDDAAMEDAGVESEQGFGSLRVIVEPWGRVVLDGHDVGGTPYAGRVRAGEHTLEGIAGERRTRRTVRIEADETTRVTLRVR